MRTGKPPRRCEPASSPRRNAPLQLSPSNATARLDGLPVQQLPQSDRPISPRSPETRLATALSPDHEFILHTTLPPSSRRLSISSRQRHQVYPVNACSPENSRAGSISCKTNSGKFRLEFSRQQTEFLPLPHARSCCRFGGRAAIRGHFTAAAASERVHHDERTGQQRSSSAAGSRSSGQSWNPRCRRARHADILLQFSLHAPRRGRADVKAFIERFREAFPISSFTARRISSPGDYVVGRWEGGGTHTGPALAIFSPARFRPRSGRKMRFTGYDGASGRERRIAEESAWTME